MSSVRGALALKEKRRRAEIFFANLLPAVTGLAERMENLNFDKGKASLKKAADIKKGGDPFFSLHELLLLVGEAWCACKHPESSEAMVLRLNLAENNKKYPVERTVGILVQEAALWCQLSEIAIPQAISEFFGEVAALEKEGLSAGDCFYAKAVFQETVLNAITAITAVGERALKPAPALAAVVGKGAAPAAAETKTAVAKRSPTVTDVRASIPPKEPTHCAGLLFGVFSLIAIDLSNRMEGSLDLSNTSKKYMRLAANIKMGEGGDSVLAFKGLWAHLGAAWACCFEGQSNLHTEGRVLLLNQVENKDKFPIERTIANLLQVAAIECATLKIVTPLNVSTFFDKVAKGEKQGLAEGRCFYTLKDLQKTLLDLQTGALKIAEPAFAPAAKSRWLLVPSRPKVYAADEKLSPTATGSLCFRFRSNSSPALYGARAQGLETVAPMPELALPPPLSPVKK